MNDKFKQHDSFRFGQETEQLRINEATQKLVNSTANAVVKDMVSVFGNGRLVEASSDLTSSDEGFSGKIDIKAEVDHDRAFKTITVSATVTDGEVELPSHESLRLAADNVKIAEPEESLFTRTKLEAALDQFELIDDGSDYLTVQHPSLYGTAIGVVSKNEYGSISDKKAFFKGMLSDKIARSHSENTYELDFTGEFVEPSATRQAAEEEMVVEAVEKKASQDEATFTPAEEKSMDDLPRGRRSDAFRQQVETEELKLTASKDKLTNIAVNNLVTHLSNLKYSSIKVASVDSELSPADHGLSGSIKVVASLDSKDGLRVASFPIEVEGDRINLPKKAEVAKLVSEGVDVKARLEEEIAKEVVSKVATVDETTEWEEKETEAIISGDSTVEKTASLDKDAAEIGGVQYIGPQNVLHIGKHLLNTPDMKLGDTIYADGFHWKLTSKDAGQLSKGEDDGSIWTFTKVDASTADEDPKAKLGN